MAIKKYKPTTPGRRGMTVTDYSVLSKVEPERSLLEPMKKSAGRNNLGRITVRHHGGGNRTKYRVIDFKRDKVDMPAVVKTLEYDPNRSAHIALVQYEDGEKRYIIAPEGLKVGDTVSDIREANAAGVVAVGVTDGSSVAGCSEAEWNALSEDDKNVVREKAKKVFLDAGADYVIRDLSELPGLVDRIEAE